MQSWSNKNKRGYKSNSVGKWIGGRLYLHRDYLDTLTPSLQNLVSRNIRLLPDGAVWNCVKIDPGNGSVTFQYSDDFDTAHEPSVTHNYALSPVSGKYEYNTLGKGTIWHHKWQWVGDDYPGFDVDAERARSDFWKTVLAEHEDEIRDSIEMYTGKRFARLTSIIGQKRVWDNAVLPVLEKYRKTYCGLSETLLYGIVKNAVNEALSYKQEFTSKNTSINANNLPLSHKKLLMHTKGEVSKVNPDFVLPRGGYNLDLGGGRYDNATLAWKSVGVRNVIFDPYWRDADTNTMAYEMASFRAFDTVTCFNVLNVIKEREIRLNLILQAAKAIRKDGTAYFSFYIGNKSGGGRQTSKDSYQTNMPTDAYLEDICSYFGDVTVKSCIIIAKSPKPIVDKLTSYWIIDSANELEKTL